MSVASLNWDALAFGAFCSAIFLLYLTMGGGPDVHSDSLRTLGAVKRAFRWGINDGGDNRRDAAMVALKRLAEEAQGDAAQREAIATFVRRRIAKLLKRTDFWSSQDVVHSLEALAAARPAWEATFLERVAGSRLQPGVRGIAMRRIAELRGRDALDLMLGWLDDPGVAAAVGHSIASLGPSAATPQVIARIRRLLAEAGDQFAASSAARALIALGHGDDPTLRTYRDRLEPWMRFLVRLEADGVAAERLVEHLLSAGVIGADRRGRVNARTLARLRARLDDGSGFEAVQGLLKGTRSALVFDTEDATVPPDYEGLMRDLGELAAPRIEIADAEFGSGRLTFRCCGEAVEIAPADMGDWFDLPAVLKGLNQAIAEAGRPERFATLPTGGQEALVLLGEVDGLNRLVRDLDFPIEADPGSAIAIGQGFEQYVADQITAQR